MTISSNCDCCSDEGSDDDDVEWYGEHDCGHNDHDDNGATDVMVLKLIYGVIHVYLFVNSWTYY